MYSVNIITFCNLFDSHFAAFFPRNGFPLSIWRRTNLFMLVILQILSEKPHSQKKRSGKRNKQIAKRNNCTGKLFTCKKTQLLVLVPCEGRGDISRKLQNCQLSLQGVFSVIFTVVIFAGIMWLCYDCKFKLCDFCYVQLGRLS